MSAIDLNAFQWFTPKPKISMIITIPNTEHININPKLLEKLPSHISIGVSPNGHQLAIQEGENGYKLIKSGSIKDPELIKHITALGVRLPARYTVTAENGYWFASLEAQGTPAVSTKKISKTPRAKNLSGLRAELEGRT